MSITRVKHMAHLKQKQISDKSCKSIIVDTLLETVRPLTQAELAREITSLFHVLVSDERLNKVIDDLSRDGIVYLNSEGHIMLTPSKQADFIIARLKETNLCKNATHAWISYLQTFKEISPKLETTLSQALPIFLRGLFVKHGVSSYELLTSANDNSIFDLNHIARGIAEQFDEAQTDDIVCLLPTIFQCLHDIEVFEYLKHSIEKAVGYISEVISKENLTQITEGLKSLVVYLDTNTIYRLLNLQGVSRYESIKETLAFCKDYGIKLKISALTKNELSARLKYDSKILMQFPTKTDLAKAGYKYRTSDNYVSTYWLQARENKISIDDYIGYYKNFDIILRAEGIEIEDIEIDEEPLIERAKNYYGKMSIRDHEKSDFALWHDAYNFAYVQKMQKTSAKTAVDTQCLFLTTDQALTSFQREEHELKDRAPVVITPSQLLQMFAFTTADSGYEETFIKFFASSSLGITFQYDNDDIQEIISRIGHYKGVSVEIAEQILARQLVDDRYSGYLSATSDEEKEEIIYNSISEELIKDLELAKEQVSELKNEHAQLNEDYKVIIEMLSENEERYTVERLKLQSEAYEASQLRDAEAEARQEVEKKYQLAEQYSLAQENLYANETLERWIKKRRRLLGFGIILAISIIVLSLFLWFYLDDSGCLGLLSALCIPIIFITFGLEAFSSNAKAEQRKLILKAYRDKLNP